MSSAKSRRVADPAKKRASASKPLQLPKAGAKSSAKHGATSSQHAARKSAKATDSKKAGASKAAAKPTAARSAAAKTVAAKTVVGRAEPATQPLHPALSAPSARLPVPSGSAGASRVPPGARPIVGMKPLPPLASRPLPPAKTNLPSRAAPGSGHPVSAMHPAGAGAFPSTKPPSLARPASSKQQPQLVRSFYFAELREGDDLPQLVRPAIDRVQIARYAGAANDFNRLQLDEPYAHSLGFRGAFAPGALAMGFVGQLLTNWLKRGQVRRLAARFVKIIWPGDELTCHGRISELRKEKGLCYADLELWAENQKGELVLRGQATCELLESPGSGQSLVGGDRARMMGTRPPSRRR